MVEFFTLPPAERLEALNIAAKGQGQIRQLNTGWTVVHL